MSSTTTPADAPEHLVVDFDIYDQDLSIPEDKVQATVAEMAEKGPVVYTPAHGGHWVVTRYKEINEVLHDPKTFSSKPNFILHGEGGRFLPLEADPPEHGSYRGVIQPLFNPTKMKALEEDIRIHCTSLIDGFIEAGECDFVGAFAKKLPELVFLSLMGLPLEDADKFSEWTQAMLMGKPGGTEEESAAVRAEVQEKVFEYFQKVVDDYRGKSVDDEEMDVVTVAVNAEAEFDGELRLLTDEELKHLFFLVLIGGLHTTQGSLAWGVKYLSENPDQRAKIIEDPSRIPEAVEEILRIEAAILPGRKATCDYELGGVQIKAGDQLILALCGANRDPAEFGDPNTFDVERKPNRHISFSHGRHRCIGSHLARQELRIAFEEILKRFPDFEPADTAYFHPSQTRGALWMPIKFTPGTKS